MERSVIFNIKYIGGTPTKKKQKKQRKPSEGHMKKYA
jgi:hypothetical protein